MARWLYDPLAVPQEGEGGGGGGGGGGEGGAKIDGVNVFSKAQVEALVAQEVAGLKSKTDELLGKIADMKPLKDLIGDMDPEKLGSALELASEAEKKKLRAEGDFNKLIETHGSEMQALKEQHSAATEKAGSRNKLLSDALFDSLARNSAMQAVVEAGGDPLFLMPLLTPQIRVIENEQATDVSKRFTTVVVGPDGKTQRFKDGAGTPFSIADAVAEMKADEKFGAAFAASDSTGSGAGGHKRGGGGGGGGEFTISRADSKNVQKYRAVRAEAEKAGKHVTIVD